MIEIQTNKIYQSMYGFWVQIKNLAVRFEFSLQCFRAFDLTSFPLEVWVRIMDREKNIFFCIGSVIRTTTAQCNLGDQQPRLSLKAEEAKTEQRVI